MPVRVYMPSEEMRCRIDAGVASRIGPGENLRDMLRSGAGSRNARPFIRLRRGFSGVFGDRRVRPGLFIPLAGSQLARLKLNEPSGTEILTPPGAEAR
jgi:hypothetical protein